jgi:RimJ/RimL family protein N-acetyltransferase
LIETDRLILRLPSIEDAETFVPFFADRDVMRFLGGKTVPREAVPGVIQRWVDDWRDNGVGKLVAEDRAGTAVGRVGINVWDARTWTQGTYASAGDAARPELAWALLRAYWGRGYATEAAAAVRDWVRDTKRVEGELISLVAPANDRSTRVAEKLGATRSEAVADGALDVWVHPR